MYTVCKLITSHVRVYLYIGISYTYMYIYNVYVDYLYHMHVYGNENLYIAVSLMLLSNVKNSYTTCFRCDNMYITTCTNGTCVYIYTNAWIDNKGKLMKARLLVQGSN